MHLWVFVKLKKMLKVNVGVNLWFKGKTDVLQPKEGKGILFVILCKMIVRTSKTNNIAMSQQNWSTFFSIVTKV
jgi:hypothetical protein